MNQIGKLSLAEAAAHAGLSFDGKTLSMPESDTQADARLSVPPMLDRLANPAEAQPPLKKSPKFDLEDFAAKYHAADCLHAFLVSVTNEDVALSTAQESLEDLKRLHAHVSQGRSILQQSIVYTAISLAECRLADVEQAIKDGRWEE